MNTSRKSTGSLQEVTRKYILSCYRTRGKRVGKILLCVVLYTDSLPPPLAGIGKLPAMAGRYFGIGITVGIFDYTFWREHLLKISRELFF